MEKFLFNLQELLQKELKGIPLWLIILLLFSLLLRVYDLGSRPFWEDEALYTLASQQIKDNPLTSPTFPRSTTVISGHPPLFYYIMLFFHTIFGVNEFSSRITSALLGSLTVIFIYLIAKKLYDKKSAFFSSVFLSLSSNHLVYSREALTVVTGIFFLSSFIYIFLMFLERRSFTLYVLTAATGLLALLSHFLNVVIIFLIPLIFFLKRRGDLFKSRNFLSLYIFFIFVELSLFIWFVLNSVSPLFENPVYNFKESLNDENIFYNFPGFVVSFQSAILKWFELISHLTVSNISSIAYELLVNYFTPSFLYIPSFFFIIFLIHTFVTKDVYDIFLISWIIILLLIILIPVAGIMKGAGLSVIRAHPFLILPLFLIMGRAANLLHAKNRFFILVTFLLLISYLTHVPLILSKYAITDPSRYISRFELPLMKTESIVCSGEKYRPPYCFNQHPVKYDDSIDWRVAFQYLQANADSSDTIYLSMLAPYIYYTNMDGIDLHCNVNHVFCNVTAELIKSDKKIWFVIDQGRYDWQLNDFEKNYLKKCKFTELSNLWLYECN